MTSQTILYIIISAVLALLIVLFMYAYKTKFSNKLKWIFGILRFVTLFLILLLLINPKFRTDVSRFLVTPFLFLNAGMKPSVLDKFLITLLILGKLLLSRGTSGKQNILILTFGIRVRPQLSAYLNFLVWIFDRYVDPVKLMKTYHGENHLFTRTIQHLKQLKYKIN